MAGAPKPFSELGCISKETLDVLTAQTFVRTTPVQEATIPLFCGNKDVAVDACTGSGKTLAFVIPLVERLRRLEDGLKQHQVGAIIVSPTRELAKQIHGVAEPFIASVPNLQSLLLVGGMDPAQDVARFKSHGGHVLIGTPGRLDDIIKRCSAMDLRRLEVLILDEADRLLDMGFKVQLDSIMARLPKQRRTGLFSATQTEAVEALVRAGLRNPVRINVAVTTAPTKAPAAGAKAGSKGAAAAAAAAGGGGQAAEAAAAATGGDDAAMQKTPMGLTIRYLMCEADDKVPQLVHFLAQHYRQHKVIVYFMTCAMVDFFAVALKRLPQLKGCEMRALHGKMKQAARENTLDAYSKLPAGVLLCTDLAARGLDIPDVHWIVQFDPPQDPAAFIHRVGRTARMGRSGDALALLLPNEETYVDFLRLRKVPLQEAAPLQGGADSDAAPPSTSSSPSPSSSSLSSSSAQVLSALRAAAERDREVMEKGARAFVSYVRGYKEHQCKFIFRVQELDLGRLATSLGLLRLPKMPDLKKPLGVEHFTPSVVDPATIPYRDKAREKQRQQLLKQQAAAAQAAGAAVGDKRKAPDGASGGAAGKRAAAAAAAAQQAEAAARLPAAKRRQLQQIDEMTTLNKEYALLRKLKKGKLSEHEYDVATGLSSDSEEDGDGGGNGRGRGTPAAAQPKSMPGGSSDDDSGDDEDAGGGGGGGGRAQPAGTSGRGAGGSGSGSGGGNSKAARHSQGQGGQGQAQKHRQHGKAKGKGALRDDGEGGGALQSYLAKKQKRKKRKAKAQAGG